MGERTAAGIILVLAGSLALAGCVPTAPTPVPTQTAAESPGATPAPTATTPAEPVLVESGTATENRPYFDKVNTAFFAANGRSDGRSIIENLIAAGFRKQDMEVTPDRTSIDLDADSVIFSVRVKGECLIGQFSNMGYSTIQAPLLGSGGCLVGATRPIDW